MTIRQTIEASLKKLGLRFGSTRFIIPIGNYVLKLPRFDSWRLFLNGLLGNMTEVQFNKMREWDDYLCPIVFSLPLGFLVVMPKCRTFNHLWDSDKKMRDKILEETNGLVENKTCSFGYLNGNLVAVDYGG